MGTSLQERWSVCQSDVENSPVLGSLSLTVFPRTIRRLLFWPQNPFSASVRARPSYSLVNELYRDGEQALGLRRFCLVIR
jgi:hypothetical protein